VDRFRGPEGMGRTSETSAGVPVAKAFRPRRHPEGCSTLPAPLGGAVSLERRWSNRWFPNGYLVTTSSQSPPTP
jgi:hypothetical protein